MRWRNALRLSALLLVAAIPAAAHADPDLLWKIVHDRCVPNEEQHGQPAPCTLVDLHAGEAGGWVVLKDVRGTTQYLLIPTARVTGIEDPVLLRPGSPNYFAAAWQERSYTEHAAGHTLPRDAVSLAVNSPFGRSQNQLHIHIDCIRRDVRDALRRLLPRIGDQWTPLAARLARHRYWAMRVIGDDLGGADPFQLLAGKKPGAAAAMNRQTVVVVGAELPGGRSGFILLASQLDLPRGNHASAEELQDHSCALAQQQQ
jgi:CDP-diacylglycerol pyrophosphatase